MNNEHGAETDGKSPIEQAVEVFVYAPLGLALEARNLLPQLVERGRQQVTMARMIGQFAMRQGQSGATKVLVKATDQANTVLTDLGLLNREPDAAEPAPPKPAQPTAAAAATVAAITPAEPAPRSGNAGGLAIADYESLAASQVIPRLPGLSGEELEAVRHYEAAHRGRKTVLNRIAQLQST